MGEVMAKGDMFNRGSQSRLGWEFFGAELRRVRDRAGMTQSELGTRVYCSGSYIGQFEAAMRKPQLDLSERIDVALETGGLFGRMCRELIDSSPLEDYFVGAAELQTLADTICTYNGMLIPGLLQTEGYARALFDSALPFRTEEDTKNRVRIRTERGGLLTGENPPRFWVVLDELVLRRPIGSDADMAEQLNHIIKLITSRRVLMQVLPYSSREHALLEGSIMLMTFPDAPPVAYAESPFNGELLDDPALVARCQTAYDLVRAAALPLAASLAMIRSAAKEYGNEP
jgi:transcriptional regulator with XRE-family HTH domain